MSFIGFNGKGYNSFVGESTDLIHWENFRLAMGFGAPGEFNHGGRVIGAYLYNDWDVKAKRNLRRKDNLYWTLYGCYPKQGGYEMRPGQEGLASSHDGITWNRAWPEQTLSIYQKDVKEWEKSCIYQPWLVDVKGKYYCFYTAAHNSYEQSGFATSSNLINWSRYADNPVIHNRPLLYDSHIASDPKVFWDTDHWVMFYFGCDRGCSIMFAGSNDLEHWTADVEPLYKNGGHPKGLDKSAAHKIALVWNAKTETYYMYYCAVGPKYRCIALLTSKPLA
jgi:hypothetical protein